MISTSTEAIHNMIAYYASNAPNMCPMHPIHTLLTGPRLLDVDTLRALRKSGRSLCFGSWDGVCIPVTLSRLLGTCGAACTGPGDPLAPMRPMRSCIGDRILFKTTFVLVLSAAGNKGLNMICYYPLKINSTKCNLTNPIRKKKQITHPYFIITL